MIHSIIEETVIEKLLTVNKTGSNVLLILFLTSSASFFNLAIPNPNRINVITKFNVNLLGLFIFEFCCVVISTVHERNWKLTIKKTTG